MHCRLRGISLEYSTFCTNPTLVIKGTTSIVSEAPKLLEHLLQRKDLKFNQKVIQYFCYSIRETCQRYLVFYCKAICNIIIPPLIAAYYLWTYNFFLAPTFK